MSSAIDNQAGVEFNPFKNVDLFSDALDFDNTNHTDNSYKIDAVREKTHYKIAKILFMVSVNLYDFVGLLEILPCGTLHSTKPYVSYRMKLN